VAATVEVLSVDEGGQCHGYSYKYASNEPFSKTKPSHLFTVSQFLLITHAYLASIVDFGAETCVFIEFVFATDAVFRVI
jgi:hypothetical protein